jgi:hypothetical protein
LDVPAPLVAAPALPTDATAPTIAMANVAASTALTLRMRAPPHLVL